MNNLFKQKIFTIFVSIICVYLLIILTNYTFPIIFRYVLRVISILTPFIAAFFFAFLLHTLVDRLEARGINRGIAVLFVFLLFLILIAYIISSLVPIVIGQVNELSTQIPNMYSNLETMINEFWFRFSFVPKQYQFSIHDVESWTADTLLNVNFTKSRINSILDSFNVIVLTPIITYYFLYDYNRIKEKLKKFLLKKRFKFMYKFLHELDNGIGAYFRGLILIMNMLTIICTILFMIFGLPYPLLFGFIIGYTNIIPIIGPYIGGFPAVLFALTSSFRLAIIVTIIIVVVQALESNIITPYVQSKTIDAHPLLILLAFVIFGKLFGLVGMIFAIPLLYIILLISKYIRMYLKLKKYKKANINVYKV